MLFGEIAAVFSEKYTKYIHQARNRALDVSADGSYNSYCS
jgi:hypothetical protein